MPIICTYFTEKDGTLTVTAKGRKIATLKETVPARCNRGRE